MFDVYVLFLILSGISMLVMAFVRTSYAKRRQVLNFILGAGFTIYGLYLLLVFNGGHYVMFYYAFVLPILMIVGFFRDRAAAMSQKKINAARPAPGVGFPPGVGAYPSAAGSYLQTARDFTPPAGDNSPSAGGVQPPATPWMNGPEAGNAQANGYQGESNRW
jgi:hypothetical protein